MKICCGGFNLGEGLTLDGKTLNVAGNGGLPTPKKDGVALIGYNGQFMQISGYGYETPKAFEDIVWDGNTEGHAAAKAILGGEELIIAYKIAEYIDSSQLIDGTITVSFDGIEQTITITESHIGLSPYTEDFYVCTDYIFAVKAAGTYNYDGFDVTFSEAGIYSSYAEDSFVSKITAATDVQQFDEKYIPNTKFVVNVTMLDGAEVADKTIK